MIERTPGPWKAGKFSSVVGCPITAQPDPSRNTVVIAGVHGAFGDDYQAEVEANAAFIVRACNAHEDLLEALRRADRALENVGMADDAQARVEIRDAIAKATA
jgi:formylmethanofuran dehydrogenase subunit B